MSSHTVPHPAGAAAASPPSPSSRLMSLDALRGFDMFWIVGADTLVEALRKLSDNRAIAGLADQLDHVKWAGFHFEDLIFPMFVFIVGVSAVFSLDRTIEREGRGGAVVRILRRAVLLYVIGVLYYGGFNGSFEHIRLLGVLQRIALAYLFAGLIYCFFDWRGRLAWCIGLLVGYWALMTFVPFPDGTAGDFREGHNLANWIDSQYLPLRKWDGNHDPEGLLSTLPAIANCLIGVFAGMLLRDPENRRGLSPFAESAQQKGTVPFSEGGSRLSSKRSNRTKVLYLLAAGLAMLAAGWLWNEQFPVIKKIWTSSFVLVACGYSCLFLAAFHFIIEDLGWRRWAMPFVWIGANPITIYIVHELGVFDDIAKRFVGGQFGTNVFGDYDQLAIAIVSLALVFAFCGFLYRKKVFVRL